MANVINRTTRQLIYSANTPDYNESGWIINPDLTAVAGVPGKYWKISGESVTEMSQSEKDVVDAAEALLRKLPQGSFAVSCNCRGLAQSGRYMEFSAGSYSYIAPAFSTVIALTVNTGLLNTGVISMYKAGDLSTPLASITLSNQDSLVMADLNISLLAGDKLVVVVSSGSLQNPSMLLYIN